ncbi:MAG: ABC transporter permease subunit [Lentisphaeria bacterium]|nr:ABC transporter permease subunit [Lentisphaeria bacterium]
MFALTRFEIRKLTAQRRSLAPLLAIALMNTLFALAFTIRLHRAGDREAHRAGGRLVREFMNAFVYTQTILAPCVFMLFPVILAVLGAHLLAGEFETGRLRLVLCRPVSRWQVLLAKFSALSLFSLAMLICLLTVSYGVSASLFPPTGDVIIPGPMYMLERHVIIHAAAEAWPRLLLSYALAWPMLMSVAAMALMISMLTRHFTSAAVLTATVYFCSYIVSGIPLLSTIHPFLPTRYLPFWRYVLLADIPWGSLLRDAGWTAGYTAVFLGLAAALFSTRDV